MKANELMIGDWVRFPETNDDGESNVKIICICDDGWGYDFAYVRITGCDNPIGLNEVEPIPLTPEILEKNGFEKCGNHSWHNEILRQIYVRIVCLPEKDRDLHSGIWRFDFPCIVSAGSDDVSFRCDYVHELQHVLRLCRIEKEIVL